MELLSGDVFSGCGGLSQGMTSAGFSTRFAIEIDKAAIETFKLNHRKTKVLSNDVRKISIEDIQKLLPGNRLHLLAGCPPCQGFSTIRRLNRKQNKRDERNSLLMEYLRLVEGLKPLTIMLENVPGLINYYLFPAFIARLQEIGYKLDFEIVNIKDFGVPQSRRRLVLVGSLLGEISVAQALECKTSTVRETIEHLPPPSVSEDWLHKVVAVHSPQVMERIRLTPKNGGSRKDLPERYTLTCHNAIESGFNDIYGRLRWDRPSSTITGGCLNPSKGRFLHPEQDRCISAREASLLQSFPLTYRFAKGTSKTDLAVMIGNALPPKFSYHQSKNIFEHLRHHSQISPKKFN